MYYDGNILQLFLNISIRANNKVTIQKSSIHFNSGELIRIQGKNAWESNGTNSTAL
jgi:hypothetical protein